MNSKDSAYTIFNNALELDDAAARARYVKEACANDAALCARVGKLLQADGEAGGFLPTDPAQVVTAPVSPMMEKSGDVIGRYQLLEQIGEGGCGVVYMAEQQEPVRRRVALKVIKLGMDTNQVVARFEAERQALALMDHPNIARVLDAGSTSSGRPYFVMELVRGMKITEFCDRKKLSTEERLKLFIQVCQAVQHAHQKGIIHRDLKPSNILVTIVDGAPVPKVIDFGIAKATSNQPLTDKTLFTAFEQFIGTPAYMSPEQAEMSGVDVDTRTDLYSLGVVLYELLTGKTPFDAEELVGAGIDQIRRTIREQEPPKPSTRLHTLAHPDLTTTAQARRTDEHKLLQSVSGDLDWIVMKCLEKERSRRYETVNGLATDIQRHLNNEPVTARPPSHLYRFQKLACRNKLAFVAAGLVSTALVLGITMSTWQTVRATRAEKKSAAALTLVSAERDAKELARQDAEAISKFLTEVFQSPDPTRDGRTITVAQTLDKATKKLETDLADQPGRRAKLQATLANTYASLSIWGEATRLRKKVRDYYVATFGPEHPDTLTAMFNLAASRRNENLPLMEEVLTLRRKVLGPEHPDTLLTMSSLAVFYNADDRSDEAIKLAEQALALHRKVLGPEHQNTFVALYKLAYCYGGAGRFEEAIKLLHEVLTHQRKTLGPKHPATLFTMWNLGDFLRKAGRQAEGIEMMEASVKVRLEVQGKEHGDTRWALGELADIYETAGNKDGILKLREELSAGKPGNTVLATQLGASQIWFGRDAAYTATVRRMLDWAENATKAHDLERVAKLACLRPIDDKPTREAALRLAIKAVEIGKGNRSEIPWCSLALGMAEYRNAHYAEAIEALTAAETTAAGLDTKQHRAHISGTAAFYRAMSLFHQGQLAEARTLFTATEAVMNPVPLVTRIIEAEANHNDLILWLAFKEAHALLANAGEAPKK